MAWTIKDAIDVVRDNLHDTRVGNYRNSDAKLLRYFNMAISEARKVRPDLFLPLADNPFELYFPSDLTDLTEFPIDGMYFPAVVNYVTGAVEVSEDEFAVSTAREATSPVNFTILVATTTPSRVIVTVQERGVLSLRIVRAS